MGRPRRDIQSGCLSVRSDVTGGRCYDRSVRRLNDRAGISLDKDHVVDDAFTPPVFSAMTRIARRSCSLVMVPQDRPRRPPR